MARTRLLRRLLVLLLLAASQAVPAVEVLRLGTNVWPGYELLYLASEHEQWPEQLGVRLVEYPSATEVLRAFRHKSLEAAALTLDEVLMLQQADLAVQVVAVLDISAGGDVVLAGPAIETFADLKGRRIAVESGALGAYMITRAFDLNGMRLADVQVVHLDISAHERAFRTGQVDAVVTFEPVKTRLLAAGARELFSSRQIHGEIVDVLAVRADVLTARPDQIRALIAGWFRALQMMRERPRETARFTAQRLKITPNEVLQSYEGMILPGVEENRRLLTGGLQDTLQRMQQTLLDRGLLRRRTSLSGLLSDRYLPH